MKFQPVIGLEIHIELKTKSKMFCSCLNDPNEKHPNVNICPICLGHPGVLPVINEEALQKTIKTGLALNCQIPEYSKFDRKNYFYPDLPKGYQISQYDLPLGVRGFLKINGKKIRIKRIHLEEDTGKLIHPQGRDISLIDFNRAGIPLMELVTEPDLRSAEEAREFGEELQLILRYLNVSDADMEKGQLRIEANISLLPESEKGKTKNKKLGVKVEIKNLNSFRAVEKALNYEIDRQSKILKAGKKVIQETRGWDELREITIAQRAKEEAPDYRYFPEPDLPILHLGTKNYLKKILAEIPELPQFRRERFKKEYELLDEEIEIFVFNKELGEYFEKVMSELKNWIKEEKLKRKVAKEEYRKLIKLATNYITTDLQGLLKATSTSISKILITPENFAEFISLIHLDKISSKIAKQVLIKMFETGGDPSQIVEKERLTQITDKAEIEKLVKKIISKNQKAVEDFKKGKVNAFQFLIGEVMRETRGRASPQIVNSILRKYL